MCLRVGRNVRIFGVAKLSITQFTSLVVWHCFKFTLLPRNKTHNTTTIITTTTKHKTTTTTHKNKQTTDMHYDPVLIWIEWNEYNYFIWRIFCLKNELVLFSIIICFKTSINSYFKNKVQFYNSIHYQIIPVVGFNIKNR